MKQKRSKPAGLKKKAPHREEKQFVPSWISSGLLIPLLLILAGIVWYGFFAIHTNDVSGSDDREYASIARNIVNGKGIARNFVYPIDINFFAKFPVPEFMHPPGYPLIIAGFFKLFGVSDRAAVLPSYLSYFILVILFFYFTKTYLELGTAVLATVILIFSKVILDVSIVALSEAVYTLFFLLFFMVFIKANSLGDIFLAGILLAASHLIRENIYPFLIPLFAFLYFYPDLPRSKKMIFFALGILVPILPNILRSYIDTGSPSFSYGKFVLMAFTEKYPGLSIYRDIQNPSLVDFLREVPGQIFIKYLNNLANTFKEILSNFNPCLLVFFIVEMFYWKVNPAYKRMKILFLSLFASQILFVCLFTSTYRFFIPFLPMMILFASESVWRLSNILAGQVKVHWRRGILLLGRFAFLMFLIVPTAHLIVTSKGPPQLGFKIPQTFYLIPREEARKLIHFLDDELKKDKVVWTDLPEILEWEGNRFCGWLPTRIETIYEIDKKIPVDAILITNFGATVRPSGEGWKELLRSEQSLPHFRNVKRYTRWPIFAKLLVRDEKNKE
ncbi:MAG: glycosyltransferase family 39 protein [Thermodesulfobacteriota bacterium]